MCGTGPYPPSSVEREERFHPCMGRGLAYFCTSLKGRYPATMPMYRLLLLLFSALVLASCGEFNKALKSTDLDYKMEVAERYYAAEGWDRAIPLLEELIVLTRGTGRSERVNYMHAKAHFGMKDHILGAY